ncbi:tape measure protein, partial [Pseudomonas aeruginosa]
MASRIRNATSSAEEYAMVQERLLQTANGTFRALSEAQEVYLATADTLRDLGYTTSDVLDITDSFSYALVRDAARADQATTAMDAWSKALMKNKVEADGWASIMAATPSIVEGIAEATGRTQAEIRQLGASGKLSVEALNEGLRRTRDENKALADEMETSVADSFTKLRNSMTVFIGKVNESSGASQILT